MKLPWTRRREQDRIRQAEGEEEVHRRRQQEFRERKGWRIPPDTTRQMEEEMREITRIPPLGPSGASDANAEDWANLTGRPTPFPPSVLASMVHPPEAFPNPVLRRFDGQGWTPPVEMHTFGDPAYTITTNDTQEEPVTVVRPAAETAPHRKEVILQLVVGERMQFIFEKMRNESGMIGFLGTVNLPEYAAEIPEGARPAEEIWVPIANIVSIAIGAYAEPEV